MGLPAADGADGGVVRKRAGWSASHEIVDARRTGLYCYILHIQLMDSPQLEYGSLSISTRAGLAGTTAPVEARK